MYFQSLINYERSKTKQIEIGKIPVGDQNPIRIQTMTNTLTRDIDKTYSQVIACIEAGAEYVRITTPTLADVDAIETIKQKILVKYPNAVIIADIHFSPKVALTAAKHAHKIRINPGNYVDKNTLSTDNNELPEIENNLRPLIDVCKQYNTAIRVGTNQGSLSNRIRQKYGETPLGLVEATYEYIEIFRKLNFENIILSVKSSNPTVMVQANRLLVDRLKEKNIMFPLHLGVTEAGNKTEGRIKSALGIGALLIDGIGDTIRVSLTESPEAELPICKKIINHVEKRKNQTKLPEINELFFDPYSFLRRSTYQILDIGGTKQPVVIADVTQKQFKTNEFVPDFVITDISKIHQIDKKEIQIILPFDQWKKNNETLPLLNVEQYLHNRDLKSCFVELNYEQLTDELIEAVNTRKNAVFIINPRTDNTIGEIRLFFSLLNQKKCNAPVIVKLDYNIEELEDFEIAASIDSSVFLIDGLCDGLLITNKTADQTSMETDTTFEILQASHRRISKTEYISCPSCGRTLFDIERTAEEIQEATKHLKGLKIGIMGCIVNGPGEIADADYGYIGAGKGLVNLFKGKNPVKINVPAENAVEELINLIKTHNDWIERS